MKWFKRFFAHKPDTSASPLKCGCATEHCGAGYDGRTFRACRTKAYKKAYDLVSKHYNK